MVYIYEKLMTKTSCFKVSQPHIFNPLLKVIGETFALSKGLALKSANCIFVDYWNFCFSMVGDTGLEPARIRH